jgi:hypothetical protein
MRKTRLEILQEETDECHTILETLYIERDIALIVGETSVLTDIGNQIQAILKRLQAVKSLLAKAENPENVIYKEDFDGWIIITPEGTGHGEKE